MTADLRCVGTPISWLRLEQHAAGELPSAERETITAHLATCTTCAACLARIAADAALPLPLLAPAPAPAPARLFTLRRLAPPLAALAVAAAILLFLRRAPRDDARDLDPISARTKGGDVSFVLVRDDDSLVAEAGGIYRDGDRWKALVTCPPGMRASFDLAVYEHGQAAFPLAAPPSLECGNAVPLPGAFRTTGKDRMTVCLVWNDGAAVDRASLRTAAPEQLPRASCKTLEPAP